jgi:hypothetical protein
LLEPVLPRALLNFECPLSSKVKVALYERLSVYTAAFVGTNQAGQEVVRFGNKEFMLAWSDEKF